MADVERYNTEVGQDSQPANSGLSPWLVGALFAAAIFLLYNDPAAKMRRNAASGRTARGRWVKSGAYGDWEFEE